MSKVEVRRNYYGYKIYLNDLLHLYIATPSVLTIESWVDSHASRYYIEYNLDGRDLRTEYQDRDTWAAILSQLDRLLL